MYSHHHDAEWFVCYQANIASELKKYYSKPLDRRVRSAAFASKS